MNFQFPASKVKAALIFAADGDIRYYLNGVMFTKAPDGKGIIAVSTDGHRLSVVYHAQDVDALPDFQAIVPREELATAAKNPLKAGRQEMDLAFEVEQVRTTDETGTNHVFPMTVAITGAVKVECKAIEGKFPDWSRVVPAKFGPMAVCEKGKAPEHYVGIDAAYMGDYAKVAKVLGNRSTGITFAQGAGSASFVVNILGQPDFVSVLMSMRTDAPSLPDWLQPAEEEQKLAA